MYCVVQSKTVIFFTWDRTITFSAAADKYHGVGFGNI
jgi:hypothetical protein